MLDMAIVSFVKQIRRENFLLLLPSAHSLYLKEGSDENKWSKVIHDGKSWAVRYAEEINDKYDIKISGNLVECINNVVSHLCKLDFESRQSEIEDEFSKFRDYHVIEYERFCFNSTSYLQKYKKNDEEDDLLDERDEDYDVYGEDDDDEEEIEINVRFEDYDGVEYDLEVESEEHQNRLVNDNPFDRGRANLWTMINANSLRDSTSWTHEAVTFVDTWSYYTYIPRDSGDAE
jgi:hypothetical protein